MKSTAANKTNSLQIAEEKALVILMQTGTPAESTNAFNKLYKRHKDSINYKMLRAFNMDKEAARDNTQEVFTKVFLKIGLYDHSFAVSTWIHTIAQNHIIDQKRKNTFEVLNYEMLGVNPNQDSDSEGTTPMSFQLADPSVNNFEQVIKQERAAQLHVAINKLKSVDARKAVKLLYIEDMPYEEISKKMQMPKGTIKSIIFRAKTELKELLSKKSVDFNYAN